MSKYCYGKISKSNKYYVRLKSWHTMTDEKGDLLPCCRVIKLFNYPKECVEYIEWLKKGDCQG